MEDHKIKFLNKEIIAVTGGSGFLGQHILKCLQELGQNIEEIRIIDIKPYEKKLEFENNYPIKYYNCDITNKNELDKCLDGVTSIIHSAAEINIGFYTDRNKIKNINYYGTLNIIEKCVEKSISKLVFSSSVVSVVKNDEKWESCGEEEDSRQNLNENEAIGGFYGFTKAMAEREISISNGLLLKNGGKLNSAVLRLTGLYGEEDFLSIPIFMKAASFSNKIIFKPALPKESAMQWTYAGNASHSHLVALKYLESPTNQGEIFYITDNTPILDFYDFMSIFVKERGVKIIKLPIPANFLSLFFMLLNFLIYFLLTDNLKEKIDGVKIIPTALVFRLMHLTKLSFSREKARKILNYHPIYSPKTSIENSKKFYNKFKI